MKRLLIGQVRSKNSDIGDNSDQYVLSLVEY